MKLLWCDDDSYGLLQPLGRILEKKGGFSVRKAASYADAMKQIKEAADENTEFRSLLLDIILPQAEGGGALASDLGIKLAENSVPHGVKSVVFLTVVRQDEIIDKYVELERKFPQTHFSYFDKTELLSRGEIEELIEKLKITGNNHSAEHSNGP